MKRVKNMLGEAIEQKEILRQARGKLALNSWSEVVGAELAKRCAPDRFERGTVWVAAEGSAWAQEIRMIRGTILLRLNNIAGEGLFQSVRVGVRPFKVVEGKPAPQEGAPRPSTDLTIAEIAAARVQRWKDEGRA